MPKAVQFTEKSYPHFDVEVATKGEDVIYHFWPPGDEVVFCKGFAKLLETGFKNTLPNDADVRAEYTSKDEAYVLMTHSQTPIHLEKQSKAGNGPMVARETYFIRVVHGTKYPLHETFLQDRVFHNIEKAIQEGP